MDGGYGRGRGTALHIGAKAIWHDRLGLQRWMGELDLGASKCTTDRVCQVEAGLRSRASATLEGVSEGGHGRSEEAIYPQSFL